MLGKIRKRHTTDRLLCDLSLLPLFSKRFPKRTNLIHERFFFFIVDHFDSSPIRVVIRVFWHWPVKNMPRHESIGRCFFDQSLKKLQEYIKYNNSTFITSILPEKEPGWRLAWTTSWTKIPDSPLLFFSLSARCTGTVIPLNQEHLVLWPPASVF